MELQVICADNYSSRCSDLLGYDMCVSSCSKKDNGRLHNSGMLDPLINVEAIMFKNCLMIIALGKLGREVSPLLSLSTGFRQGRSLASGESFARRSWSGRRRSVLLDHCSWELGQGRNAAALTGDNGACRGADQRNVQGCLLSDGASIVWRACPYFCEFCA